MNNMVGKFHNTVNIDIALMKIKFFRALLLILVVTIFTIIESVEFLNILILLILIYFILILIIGYCLLRAKHHILDSLILLISELLISSAFLIFINSLLLLPFICMQAAELVVDERNKKYLFVFLGYSLLMMFVGFILRDDLESAFYAIPSLLIVILLFSLINLQSSQNNKEYENMKKIIDNKNKLLSTLTHELRTPLAVIKTSTEIILEERPGEINETQKKFLTSVLDNTMRMVHFVDTILASIKVEYAWFRMNKNPIDVRSVIKKVCTDLSPYISSREQTLKYTYPNLLSRTIADENWIQQVLINLIHNASKHVGKNGRIIISVTENEQCVVVSVSDDGSGIVNKEKPKIFSEFYQGEESEDENMDGVGLGLSIVKSVIEKHNGKVYVGSVAGLGTTLSFTLPKEGEAGCITKF